jgi:hypothetical protein
MRGYYNGAAYADLNNDGNMDVVINCLNAPAVILENNAPKKNYLSLSFKGEGMNTTGIGVKTYLFMGTKMQYQQLMLTRGFMSSSEPRMHFGLDSLFWADSLLIVWPDQRYQLLKKVSANQHLVIKQTDAKGYFHYDSYFPKPKSILEDVSRQVVSKWKHRENPYIDFNDQYLIPHMESTRGPKLVVADVNKDGLDDFFVCGAKGQAGCLMIQNREGNFIPSDTPVFGKNRQSEGVDAVFFDANHDGYPDLYVVSGGNEYKDGDPNLQDHLYINDGHGHFNEDANAVPAILKNKSCVAIADINKDGYPDIFVGGLAIAKQYGYTKEPAYLLINDRKGHFIAAGEEVISLKETGIVTSAAFADLNGDGWDDLVVTGEWMGLKIFLNHKGIFTPAEISQSSGLWQSVCVTDINGDGNPDILAGNWGQNSKLYAGKDGPLKLYVKDFDGNGSVEQIMTYVINDQEYPFLGKDQLELAIPVLKKKHLHYDDVAGKTIQYLLGDMLNGAKELKAETLASACFINDGKENFTRKDLPEELQLAPIFSFLPFPDSGQKTWLAAGNFYGVMPYEGRYDALNPSIFSYHNNVNQFQYITAIPALTGECRDAKWLNYAGGSKILVIARNNEPLVFYKPVP